MFGTIPSISKLKVNSLIYTVIKRLSTLELEPKQLTRNVRKDERFKVSKKNTVRKLEELLSLRKNHIIEIISKCKQFLKIPTSNVDENYYFCVNQGISKATLIEYPEILAANDIPKKIEKLKTLDYDINVTSPLLVLNLYLIDYLVVNEKLTARIKMLSSVFQVHENEICRLMSKRTFLISLDINTVKAKVELLNGYGIQNNEIMNDLWVLRYTSEGMKRKLDIAKGNNLDTLKTWMVRVKPEILETYVKRRSDNKLILGNNSLVEHLSERLVCNEQIVKYIISKHPALQNKSLRKLNEMIDFLLMCGYKPIHICKTPKILLHSVETIKNRLKELEDQGMKLSTLHILTKSQKQYAEFCESLKRNKNKR